jgi:hypothetical protein
MLLPLEFNHDFQVYHPTLETLSFQYLQAPWQRSSDYSNWEKNVSNACISPESCFRIKGCPVMIAEKKMTNPSP